MAGGMPMSDGEIILYRTDDGTAQFQLTEMDGTVWMSQAEIADLFKSRRRPSLST